MSLILGESAVASIEPGRVTMAKGCVDGIDNDHVSDVATTSSSTNFSDHSSDEDFEASSSTFTEEGSPGDISRCGRSQQDFKANGKDLVETWVVERADSCQP
jgi:hypothetical protein